MKNLSEKSILVSLNISKWSARKFDRQATEEVNSNHNTTDAGRFNKLLVKKEYMKEISELETKIRDFHYTNTLPWGDNGDRLLPSENYFLYVENMGNFKSKFEQAVRDFVEEYPAIISEAKNRLNGLFSKRDYPANIADKFNVKISFMPVPDVGDIRVSLSDKEIDAIKKSVSEEISSRFTSAQKDIYSRIADQLKAMYNRLVDKEAIFRDSLFNNVLSLVDLLPRLNVSNDQNINDLCKDLKALYCEPQNVRNDVTLREKKAKDVEDLLKKVSAFI